MQRQEKDRRSKPGRVKKNRKKHQPKAKSIPTSQGRSPVDAAPKTTPAPSRASSTSSSKRTPGAGKKVVIDDGRVIPVPGKRVPRSLRQVLDKQARVEKTLGSTDFERVILSTDKQPDGHVLVPQGDVYVTRNCRKLTHEQGLPVYNVYDAMRESTTGICIPDSIAQSVHSSAAATEEARKAQVAQKDAREARAFHALLGRFFPSIPATDREVVKGHAFLKGSGRVGRKGTVKGGDQGKVRLAVEAHIRHVHTDYERLLDGGLDRSDAREKVWADVKRITSAWATTEDGAVVKDQLGEGNIIVISDSASDDDNDSNADE